MGTKWSNDDGLVVHFGTRSTDGARPNKASESVREEELVIDFTYEDLAAGAVAIMGGTIDGGLGHIPAGSYLVDALLQIDTAFVGGTNINFGFHQSDGTTAIDADGIDAAVLTAALTAGAVIVCDGADIGTVVDASNDAYITTTTTGTYTAGTGRLVLRYVPKYNA